MMDGVVKAHPGAVIQLGWKSADAEFALASGLVSQPGTSGGRPATATDTFLFGSGTKPLTAAAVLALVDQGLVSLSEPLEKHVDGVLDRLHPGASLRGLFGEAASKITVDHTLRMQSGVQDFDFPPFDQFLLRANETYRTHSPYEFVEYASTQSPRLLCEPGTCVSYSSNNFILAGLVLLAHANATEWWQLDLRSIFSSSALPSLGGLRFFQREALNRWLTVPGLTEGGWAKTPPTDIWNQSSTILGWTCGNMVGTALDMAVFMWDLLGPEPKVLPASLVADMKEFHDIDVGWGKGAISYGAGLMMETVNFLHLPPRVPEWGTYVGHGGDTYGFLSEQGIVSGLNASVSVVANRDSGDPNVQLCVMCNVISISARILLGRELSLRCFCKKPPGSAEALYV